MELATNNRAFFARLIVSFVSGVLVMFPLITLGLGLPLPIVLPLTLGFGALIASVSSWAVARVLSHSQSSATFLSILGRGVSTAALLLVAIVLLFMWGAFIAPWAAMLLVSSATIAYRVSHVPPRP